MKRQQDLHKNESQMQEENPEQNKFLNCKDSAHN